MRDPLESRPPLSWYRAGGFEPEDNLLRRLAVYTDGNVGTLPDLGNGLSGATKDLSHLLYGAMAKLAWSLYYTK
ncbi:hypothetical protein H257_13036 [Aphanomyces astaci]|uniref:Uncharacterized protein n=1 Tax=Aphanomyces astaci TaxID=112090 RepID=W4FY56_APHAT|nr:hypothetical protein H257_13036 [Aphanomyces astaci]ETV71906.1 hypothetical protein H257_13036 [Aphanomyces astaci]|eukprot:XP_009838755.1 hypothetical protein H257_13036 [Aphanomyces astaci]